MITIIDTIRAISDWIETLFQEPPTTKDVTEGYVRPCTYVQPTQMSTSVDGEMRHDTFMIEIIRFATFTRKGYLELLEYQEKLTEALERPIPVNEMFFLYPEEVEFELRRDEMILITSFSVDNFQALPDEDADAEIMETLNLRRKD